MIWMPFICIAIGVLIGSVKVISKYAEYIGNIALIFLMFTIGINIGADDLVINSLGLIGLQCAVISLCAIFVSVGFTFALEKTLLPLDGLKNQMTVDMGNFEAEEQRSPLIRIIPVCIISGVIAGRFLLPKALLSATDIIFYISISTLYISVGIGLMQNKGVFQYIRLLGWKIILPSIAILLGSITGGAVASAVLGLAPHVCVLAASGMSYYSITGAFMTQAYGIQIGTYGFLVNVFREFFTVLLLPLLIKAGKGAPIAGGAAGNMDTMLVPISKFVGVELGFVALITGTVLTLTVPVLLPVLAQILG